MPILRVQRYIYQYLVQKPKIDRSLDRLGDTVNSIGLRYRTGRIRNRAVTAINNIERAQEKKEALAQVKKDGLKLASLPEHFKRDIDIVLAALSDNGCALQFAHDSLKRDRGIVLAALKQAGWALQHVIEPLRSDKKIVLAAVRQDGMALQFAPQVLQKDKDVILTAIDQNEKAVELLADSFKKNAPFRRTLFEHNIHVYKYLPDNKIFEKEYQAVVNDLKKLDIDFPGRFKRLSVAMEIIENRRNPNRVDGRPLAILVYPKKDWGRVFELNQMTELVNRGYRVLYFEAREEQQVYQALKETTTTQKADLFVLAGHGVQDRTSLGAEDPAGKKGEREELYIDISDEAEMIAMGLSDSLAQDSVIILYSCSTGKGRKERLNVANLMKKVFPQATVFAPTEPTIILGYVYDKNGKIVYVEYSCGKENTYIARIL
jgi:hypothetical protein